MTSAPADNVIQDNFRKPDDDIFQHSVLLLACLDSEFHPRQIAAFRRPE
jgi:hypothetical protein